MTIRKFLGRAQNTVGTLLVTIIVILAILLVGVRLVGLTPYAVLSGSMEPTYPVGSLIYVKDIQPEEVKVGMPVTFIVNEDLLLATHRVVDIARVESRMEPVLDAYGKAILDEDGNPLQEEILLDEPAYYFQTKGDANQDADGAPVHHKNVVGTPVFSISYLGYLSSWLQTRQGTIMGISIALVALILTFLPDMLRLVDDESEAKEAKDGR